MEIVKVELMKYELNNLQMAEIISSAVGRPLKYKLEDFHSSRPGHDLRYAIDASKINTELGWKPSVTFEQGLARTVDWYLANEDWLNNVTSGAYKKYYEQQYGK